MAGVHAAIQQYQGFKGPHRQQAGSGRFAVQRFQGIAMDTCQDVYKRQVADCAYNTQQIIAAMRAQAVAGTKLLCLPEFTLTGYTCRCV